MARQPSTITRNGKLYTWQPDTHPVDEYSSYLGVDRDAAARTLGYDPTTLDSLEPGVGPGAYVEASAANPNGLNPFKAIGMLAGAGTPAGALGFTAFMHPDQDWLKYAAMGAGIYEGLGGGYGLNGRSVVPKLFQGGTRAATNAATSAGTSGATGGTTAATATAAGAGGAAAAGAAAGKGSMLNIPWLDDALKLYGIAGDVMGTIAANRQTGRKEQAGYNLLYDRTNLDRTEAMTQQALADLAQRKYADQANTQAQQMRRAANFQRAPNAFTARPPGVGGAPGNFGPASIPNAAASADDLERQAMIRILNPVKAAGGDTLPTLTPPEELSRTDVSPSTLDSLLSYLSLGAGTAANVADIFRPNPKPAPVAATRGMPATIPGTPVRLGTPPAETNAFNRNLMLRGPAGSFSDNLTIPTPLQLGSIVPPLQLPTRRPTTRGRPAATSLQPSLYSAVPSLY